MQPHSDAWPLIERSAVGLCHTLNLVLQNQSLQQAVQMRCQQPDNNSKSHATAICPHNTTFKVDMSYRQQAPGRSGKAATHQFVVQRSSATSSCTVNSPAYGCLQWDDHSAHPSRTTAPQRPNHMLTFFLMA